MLQSGGQPLPLPPHLRFAVGLKQAGRLAFLPVFSITAVLDVMQHGHGQAVLPDCFVAALMLPQ
eukprot:7757046-Alexandrium_andersonii.AAC.1